MTIKIFQVHRQSSSSYWLRSRVSKFPQPNRPERKLFFVCKTSFPAVAQFKENKFQLTFLITRNFKFLLMQIKKENVDLVVD